MTPHDRPWLRMPSPRTRWAAGLAAGVMSAGLIGAGLVLHGLSARSSPERASPTPSLSSTVPPPSSPGPDDAGSLSRGAPVAAPSDVGGEPGGLADILEAEGGQLTDLLAHFRTSCAAARPLPGTHAAVDAVSRCVEDADGVMGLVDLIRGSIEGPASTGMPEDARARWEDTLASARATVREALTPVWDGIGRDLTSGGSSPAAFRALAHLRDRIGRVLSTAERP